MRCSPKRGDLFALFGCALAILFAVYLWFVWKRDFGNYAVDPRMFLKQAEKVNIGMTVEEVDAVITQFSSVGGTLYDRSPTERTRRYLLDPTDTANWFAPRYLIELHFNHKGTVMEIRTGKHKILDEDPR